MNVVLLIQAFVKEDAIESFRNEALRTAAAAIKEPFCVSIDLYQNSSQPNHFTLHEVWESKDYILSDEHQKSPHILSFFKNTENMLTSPFQYDILNIASESNKSEGDRFQLERLTQQWVNLWSPKDKLFTGEGFENIFAKDKILVFDNFDNSVVVLHSLQEYLDTWVPFMQENISYWEVELEDNFEITINGDLAVTTFSWIGGGKGKDGRTIKAKQYGTHVWKRLNGQWRLVHEHLTGGEISE
jgi:quinol monooxygenase YgiN/ketosteroid isomerase-like protein